MVARVVTVEGEFSISEVVAAVVSNVVGTVNAVMDADVSIMLVLEVACVLAAVAVVRKAAAVVSVGVVSEKGTLVEAKEGFVVGAVFDGVLDV